jgi:mono/diheme cytochrome c family protein
MKKLKKFLLFLVVLIVLVVVGGISYITLCLPNVGEAENIHVPNDAKTLARGEYLVNHVVLCTDCHSQRDNSKFAGPVLDGKLGQGGEVFDEKVNFPGSVHVPNITPYNLKNWTDGEIFRAITTGVRKDGSAIFPLMPWPGYSKMAREDVYAIIAYIRTLKPVNTTYPRASYNFPLNILVHTMPQKATYGTVPNLADTVKYGGYLVNAGGCIDCHTQNVKGKMIAGMEFAGAREFRIGNNTIRSANITPDKETGIGSWSQDVFLQRFRNFSDKSKATNVSPTDPQTIMPWYDYAGMTETDLKAVYAYLKTLKPIKNKVTHFQANSFAQSAGSN